MIWLTLYKQVRYTFQETYCPKHKLHKWKINIVYWLGPMVTGLLAVECSLIHVCEYSDIKVKDVQSTIYFFFYYLQQKVWLQGPLIDCHKYY